MRKTYLLLQFAVVLAGFTGVFGKLISLNEGLLVWYRVAFSCAGLGVIMLFGSKSGTRPGVREKARIAAIGLLLTIHWLFFYGSIRLSNISVGVVCYCLTSIFTAFVGPLINRRRLRGSEIFFSLLTLCGISLIFGFDKSYRWGIVVGTVSSLFAALYTIYNERLVKVYDSKEINFYQMLSGTVVLGIFMPVYLRYFPSATLIPGLRDVAYLLVLALACTVGLYLLFAESLKRIPAFTVNLSFNLEPIYSIILAFLFFGESKELNAGFYIGLALVILSVFTQPMLAFRRRKAPGY